VRLVFEIAYSISSSLLSSISFLDPTFDVGRSPLDVFFGFRPLSTSSLKDEVALPTYFF
jgi:hypothetical protein